MSTEYHQVPNQQPFYATNSDVDPWLITATSNLTISWNGKKTKTKREAPPSSPPSLFGPDEVPWSPPAPAFPPPSSYARIKKEDLFTSANATAEEDAWTTQTDDEESSKKEKETSIEEEISGQNLYKTELCRSFVETGACRYGFKCQFAHGKNELRPVLRHPKYKTEICKTFHSTGTCPYGIRCRFIHTKPTDQELLSMEQLPSSPSPPAVVPSKWSTSWTPRAPKTKGDDDQVPDSPPSAPKKRLAIFRALC